ncbi:hypothetical protein SNE40_002863 [Patella caerulea]|uniref:Uncharacterized protein n=1 Tax=Patella caerulea TaxID=87958 RepID=A0AAN8QEL5_PATCE
MWKTECLADELKAKSSWESRKQWLTEYAEKNGTDIMKNRKQLENSAQFINERNTKYLKRPQVREPSTAREISQNKRTSPTRRIQYKHTNTDERNEQFIPRYHHQQAPIYSRRRYVSPGRSRDDRKNSRDFRDYNRSPFRDQNSNRNNYLLDKRQNRYRDRWR